MTSSQVSFPLRGVIGIVADNAEKTLATALSAGLQCIEVRADLLLDTGLNIEQLMQIVEQARRQDLACLFTLRHPEHGGTFQGSEAQRAAISRQALAAGADLIDLEWGSQAAELALDELAPQMILSHHDFNAMLGETELATLTDSMIAAGPAAIKVVPTASCLADSARMLHWVAEGSSKTTVARIGFAMGAAGACSRILTIAYGAPITYASFGAPVAPGQVAIDELLNVYRAADLNQQTRVIGIVGNDAEATAAAEALNQRLQVDQGHAVGIPFSLSLGNELEAQKDILRIDEVRLIEVRK